MTHDCAGKSVAVGEVVQILVDTHNNIFDGCFAVVDEIRSWGIVAIVYGTKGETYPVRLVSDRFKWIGKAAATRDR